MDVGLRSQFGSDFRDVFAEEQEFAREMTFEIMEDHKPKVFTDIVVWDTEALQNRMIVQQQGVYLGQVLLFILKKWFKVEPQPEQILYEVVDIGSRQVKKGWRLLNIVDVEDVYEISLDRLDV